VPTLIIHGTADAIVPIDPSSREAVKGIAGSVLKEYEGGPHGLLGSHQDRLRDDVLAFLRSA
jgi:pimeloyl-ACP methyl ester carboxylesterase